MPRPRCRGGDGVLRRAAGWGVGSDARAGVVQGSARGVRRGVAVAAAARRCTGMYRAALATLHARRAARAQPDAARRLPDRRLRQGGLVAVLALNALFLLMTRHGLEYPRFYDKLYALLMPQALVARHRGQFLELLNTVLLSGLSRVPRGGLRQAAGAAGARRRRGRRGVRGARAQPRAPPPAAGAAAARDAAAAKTTDLLPDSGPMAECSAAAAWTRRRRRPRRRRRRRPRCGVRVRGARAPAHADTHKRARGCAYVLTRAST